MLDLKSIEGCYLKHRDVDLKAYIERLGEDWLIIMKAKSIHDNKYIEFHREYVASCNIQNNLKWKAIYDRWQWMTDTICDICYNKSMMVIPLKDKGNKVELVKTCVKNHNEWLIQLMEGTPKGYLEEYCLRRLSECSTKNCRDFFESKLKKFKTKRS